MWSSCRVKCCREHDLEDETSNPVKCLDDGTNFFGGGGGVVFSGIDHLAICAKDSTALAGWYCDVLGMHVLREIPDEDRGKIYFVCGDEGAAIEIMPAMSEAGEPLEIRAHGIRHLAVLVPDFEAAEAALIAKGVEFMGECVNLGGGALLRNFRDPEGNIAQILYRP